MNILVTGCAGYIGSVLVGRLIDAGHRVFGVDNLMYDNGPALLPYLGNPHFTFWKGDVQDDTMLVPAAMACDVVIPLAALVGAPLCEKDEHAVRWAHSINTWAVSNLVDKLSPHQLVVFPNTNSGYGQTDGTRMVTEEDPLTPISVYGKTKCEAEKAVLDHPRGVVFRLATVFGASPRMRLDLMVNDFTAKLWTIQEEESDAKLELFEPHFNRNFVGVQDVAEAFVHAVTYSSVKPGVYNLGNPMANMTKLELAHRVCDVLDLSREVVTVGAGKDPDQRNYLVSNDKILGTGFSFTHDLDDGIAEVTQVMGTHTPEQLKRMRNY